MYQSSLNENRILLFWKGNGRMFNLVCDTPMMLRKIVTVQLTIGVSVMDTRGCVTVGITLKRNLVYITVKLGLSIV